MKFETKEFLRRIHYVKKYFTAQRFSFEEIIVREKIAQHAADIISKNPDVLEVVEFGSTLRRRGKPGKSDIDLGVKIEDKHPTIFNPRLKFEIQLRNHGIPTEKEIPMHVSIEVFTPDTHLTAKKPWQRQLLRDIANGKKLFSRITSEK